MKVGDLVRAPESGPSSIVYGIHNNGIVIEVVPASRNWKQHVVVSWSCGDIEMEVPEWLEVISESR